MYGGFDAPPGFDTIDRNSSADNAEFPMIVVNQPPPLFDKETDWGVYVLDSDCVALMFGMPMEIDVTIAILRFIPEIIWHAGIQTIPLEMLYGTFLECFDRSSGHPVLKPAFRDMAYLSAKALLNIGIQRKCIGDESDKAVLESISSRHRIVGSNHYKDDSDLESIWYCRPCPRQFQTYLLAELLLHRSSPHLDGPYPPLPCLGCCPERQSFTR